MTDPGYVLGLLDAVVYGDLFDCAVTADEIWTYARVEIERPALDAQLSGFVGRGILATADGYFCLPGREQLLGRRPASRARARFLERRARRIARWVQHAPFVRGIALTGSVAADDAGGGDDVDFLVFVSRGRLASVFVLLGAVSTLTRRALFCPNYYLCVDALELDRRSHYVAREIAHTKPMVGCASALRDANPWVDDVFPNFRASSAPSAEPARGSRLRAELERLLGGAAGDRLERWARDVALARLRRHHALGARPVPSDVEANLLRGAELRFHDEPEGGGFEVRYEAARTALAGRLSGTPATDAALAASIGAPR